MKREWYGTVVHVDESVVLCLYTIRYDTCSYNAVAVYHHLRIIIIIVTCTPYRCAPSLPLHTPYNRIYIQFSRVLMHINHFCFFENTKEMLAPQCMCAAHRPSNIQIVLDTIVRQRQQHQQRQHRQQHHQRNRYPNEREEKNRQFSV